MASDIGISIRATFKRRFLAGLLVSIPVIITFLIIGWFRFTTDLGVSERLRPLIPEVKIMVTESGIHTPGDVARLRRCGVDAFLVGEAFMRAADPGAALRRLFFAGDAP